MKTKITLLLTLFFITVSTFAQAQDVPKINAWGVGMVTAFPNAANITLSLRFVKPTLKEAVNENQKTAKEVLAVVKRYVSDSTTVKVSLIATDKSMRWNAALKKDVFTGFESTQRIIFTLTDLKAMQNFTEEILKTRIYEIERVSYSHTDGAAFIKQAQELAINDAIETTKRLARASGVTTGAIIYIETNSSPANAISTTSESESFQAYNKAMTISEGVTSSGQLLNFSAQVSMYTAIAQ